MVDSFAAKLVGNRISFVLMHEPGQWHGVLEEVGEQWIRVTTGKNRTTLIPICNIRTLMIETEATAAAPSRTI